MKGNGLRVRRKEQHPLVADVAVVLLVAAVELDQLRVRVRDRSGDRIGKAVQQALRDLDGKLMDILNDFNDSYCMIKPLDYDKFKALVKQVISGDRAAQGGYSIV